jgi:hypothetical protein
MCNYSTTTTTRLYALDKSKNQKDKEEEDVPIQIQPENIPRAPGEIEEMKENQQIENHVRTWLKQIVVQLNLCPFAERPLRNNNLRIYTIRGNDEHKILSSILVVLLVQQEKSGMTSLVVCPECYPDDFRAYLDVYHMIQDGLLPDHDLEETLQIAPFHPLFQFEGSSPDSVDNWTNRCPYPMFHVLREDDVSYASDLLQGDSSIVWKRNIDVLQALENVLGQKDGIQRLLTIPQTLTPDEWTQVNEILDQHKIRLKPKK